MDIQQATLVHLTQLVPLFDAYRVFYKQDSDPIRARAFLKARFENKESIVFIAFVDGEAVGFTQLYPTFSSMHTVRNWILNDLFVSPAFRKRGIAEALVQHALQFAKQQDAVFVQLETQLTNLTAQNLYKKIGFELESKGSEFLLFKKTV
ncbi:GNAT family N-acetyltransferase [Sphingobacterium sp. Mn56C]|uniref:GNAT family N-acetyltransferase n=1 Tax=Sphingobacterium sp. Mn56C TaxID=3395261 RepID=UPI003BE7C617